MPRTDDLHTLPPNLPIPPDDGACTHLPGSEVPATSLPSTRGRRVSLREESHLGRVVVFAYPRTGTPDRDPPPGWDDVPGARGCTPQACAFRDQHPTFAAMGITVFGLSVQDTAYQTEMAERLSLPFEVLSDAAFQLTDALDLPTFEIQSHRLLRRFTLVLQGGRIEKVFYPVFPSNQNAAQVLTWLRSS